MPHLLGFWKIKKGKKGREEREEGWRGRGEGAGRGGVGWCVK